MVDKFKKIASFKILTIGLIGKLGIHTKNALQRVRSKRWCEILCNYWANFYDDFKKIIRKVKTYHNKILMFST